MLDACIRLGVLGGLDWRTDNLVSVQRTFSSLVSKHALEEGPCVFT